MSKHEQVILIIEDYIFDITEPQRNWDKHWFKEVSYQRWAGNELFNTIKPYNNGWREEDEFTQAEL